MEKICKYKTSEVEIEYLITGEENSETILFVHGAGANLRQFRIQHQYFSKEYKVLSISLRGHGKSTKSAITAAEQYTIEKNRDDILEVLEYLKIQRVHYVGNSAGGMIGYELADIKPNLFMSFITFGTTAELKYPRFVVNLIAGIDKAMIKINPISYYRFVSKNSSKNENTQKEIYDLLMMASDAMPYFRKNIGNYSYLRILEKISMPFLLIQGEMDNDINKNLKSTLQVAKNSKNASVIILEEAGHFANLDKPEGFNRIVESFIKKSNNRELQG